MQHYDVFVLKKRAQKIEKRSPKKKKDRKRKIVASQANNVKVF